MEIAAIIIVILLSTLLITDNPYIFRYRSIRFLYRSGLRLYSHEFKVNSSPSTADIPLRKIEHWMSQSGFSSPVAGEDGPRRYVFMEFIWLFFTPIPLLMRAIVSWDKAENHVIIHGYATWTYFFILVYLIGLFFIPTRGQEYLCFSAFLILYLFWSIAVYISQQQRFHALGTKIAEFLSTRENDSATRNHFLAKKAG